MKVAAPPYSPPVEKPCTARSRISRIGAAIPMVSTEGIRPMQKVAPAMRMIVSARMRLRPRRSPSGPQNKPPRGRTRNENAKVLSARMVPYSPGKKFWVM